MSNPYSMFKTDEKAEKEGIILDYGDFRVKIARAGGANRSFGKLLNERLKPHKRQMDAENMDDDVANDIMIECYVDTIIKDMEVKDAVNSTKETPVYTKGILDATGNVIPYNRDNTIALFKNLPELFRDVQSQAGSVALFRATVREAEVKNLLTTSDGTQTGVTN